MARLVRERENVLDRLLLEIHQDVRVGVIGTRTEGTRLLSRVGIAVTPAAKQSAFQLRAVISPERGK